MFAILGWAEAGTVSVDRDEYGVVSVRWADRRLGSTAFLELDGQPGRVEIALDATAGLIVGMKVILAPSTDAALAAHFSAIARRPASRPCLDLSAWPRRATMDAGPEELAGASIFVECPLRWIDTATGTVILWGDDVREWVVGAAGIDFGVCGDSLTGVRIGAAGFDARPGFDSPV